MPDAHDNPDLDALVRVIESLQERIARDYDTIGADETRTRMMLIDPLLNALGWDTTNPAMVIPEYRIGRGKGVADYALLKVALGERFQPIGFVEAKRMNEDLRPHRAQALSYAKMTGVNYAGLTNGECWELYEVSKEAHLNDRCIVSVTLSSQSAFDCAVQLLPFKWPYLETGETFSARGAQELLWQALENDAASTVIGLLLDRGADVEATDRFGETPLHRVVIKADPAVIGLLLDRGADVDATDDFGWTPLHRAVIKADPAMIRLLLDRGADAEATDDLGRTPLHWAVSKADLTVISLLIDRGADIEAADNRGWTPFHEAAAPEAACVSPLCGLTIHPALHSCPHCRTPQYILCRLCSRDVRLTNLTPSGTCPDCAGIEKLKQMPVVALLLGRGADFTVTDSNGRTPLHLAAAWSADPAVTRLLIQGGANTPAAIWSWASRLTPWLFPHRGADITAMDNNGLTPLHLASCFNSNPDVTALLIDQGANVEARSGDGETPLHMAARFNSNPEVAKLLIDRGANIGATDTPYQVAEERNPSQSSQDFLNLDFWQDCTVADAQAELDRGADLMADNEKGETPLHLAGQIAPLDVIELLLEEGADITATDNDGWTPLHAAAAWNEDPEIAELLLDRGAHIEAADNNGWTPLHCAVAHNAEPAVTELLLDRGADSAALTDDGQTPSQLAAHRGSLKVLWLLREPDENFLDEDFWRWADGADVQAQLNRGADPTGRTGDGSTILHIAARWTVYPSVVVALLERGAVIEVQDREGWTPLHKAALNEEPPHRQLRLLPDPQIGDTVIETLLKNGANRHTLTDDGQTAYEIAEEQGASEEILQLLRG